ncbi:hypothetical protein HQ945_05140 [Phyllobacterium sp. BT25]|uniref:Uncharacterized protein n=1 Tax=Phyllobacterium pellucidum TaxID=2740464 RepID=A0A849VLE9_9HYPH|nr:hypothetical protein [Phyllobacterium pellucidum]NTS30632.1 hypothetical protein [Phyllobacterium pellucidum]
MPPRPMLACKSSDGTGANQAVVHSVKEEDRLVEHLVGELSLLPNIFSTKWTSTTPPE